MLPDVPVRSSLRRRLGLLLPCATMALVMIGAPAAPVASATTSQQALSERVISLINDERQKRGLVVYRTDSRLNALTLERAGRMASSGILSHDAAGPSIGKSLDARSIQWYGYGEAIGWSGYGWSTKAAAHLVRMWMGSPSHRALLLNSRYNYIGAGLAYRSANGTTWSSVILTESRDRTGPKVSMEGSSRSGTTVRFTWSGKDRRLQTHTAGLRSFDVQYRVDDGAWRTIRDNTDNFAVTLQNRAHGHWYWVRVQAADKRGNLSAWTSPKKVWVP